MGYDMLEMIKNQYYGHFSFQKKKKKIDGLRPIAEWPKGQ